MCLYLGNCTPHQIAMMPECMKRVEAVRQYRLASKSKPTQKLADTPTRFHVETFPQGNYIVVPKTSSEKRKYIPMGFLDDSVICSDALHVIPDAGLYHFGVLESLIHMAWMRIVAGRLEMRYRYSSSLVYNCFVWPSVTEKQRVRIEEAAQGILDARAKYPDSSLAELYSETLMPIELRCAHRENDDAVREAYGFDEDVSEEGIVAELMGSYVSITKKHMQKELSRLTQAEYDEIEDLVNQALAASNKTAAKEFIRRLEALKWSFDGTVSSILSKLCRSTMNASGRVADKERKQYFCRMDLSELRTFVVK